MKFAEDIERLLGHFGGAWPGDGSIVDGVMQKIAAAPVPPSPIKRRRIAMKAMLGIAACLALGVIVWLATFLSLPPAVTLAQVQAAVARQKWMHVKYDNGRELRTTVDGAVNYNKAPNGFITYFNYPKNVRLDYWPESGNISESRPFGPGVTPPAWKPRTIAQIVGFSMDTPEGEATAKQKQRIVYAERRNDTIERRPLVRFDQFEKNALGQYQLWNQIWVDPQTRLPVRVRTLIQLAERKDLDRRYTTGDYQFSDHGPESIYDFGVPRSAPIVREDVKPPKDVAKVLDLARQARDAFPTRDRLVVWSDGDPHTNINLIYRDGAPVRKLPSYDWRGVRVRQAYFFNMDKKNPAYHLPLPATADQVLAWTKTQVPVGIDISDGTRSFAKEGALPPPFHHPGKNVGPPRLEVRRVFSGGGIAINSQFWPTDDQWPMVEQAGPSAAFLNEGRENLPGTIAIRHEAGNIRRDFYIDPNRDYICIKWVWWEKTAGKWAKEREYTLLDLKKLPEGQWYATKERLTTYGSPQRKTRGYELTWNLDFQLLKKDDFPPDIFNGDKLLEESKRDGTVIESY